MYLGRRLPIAVLLGVVPAVLSPVQPWAVLVAVESLVLLVLAVDMLIAPDPWRLRLRRRVPEVLRLGRTAEIVLTLHNPTSRRLEVAIHDAAPPSLSRAPLRHRVRLDPGAWADLPAEVRPARRGKAVLGPVTVRTRGPLGLGGRQGTYSLLQEVRVYPAFRGRAEVELRIRRGRLLQVGLRSSALRGGGSDFDSLREYRPDDEFRRINWRATARSTKPIANEFREERNQQVILLVDASRAMAAQVEGVSRLEHALDAAVAVAELASRVGDHVGAVAFGRDVRAEIGPRDPGPTAADRRSVVRSRALARSPELRRGLRRASRPAPPAGVARPFHGPPRAVGPRAVAPGHPGASLPPSGDGRRRS
jgi:uncharacterized protein (DUF58 family)